nr:RNA-directed DNA polymerase, eukaryota, reverse transcriptase zinc-binding domain protein [Tanacetum cinerariifolium]
MVMSGTQRSKEEDVQKILTSVFVTNFLDGTKAGKRFDFVRFIKVFDIDRLINNLRMVSVGRNKIHTNVARFQRKPIHKQSNKVNNKGTNDVNHGAKGMTNSYTYVVKGNQVQNVGMEKYPNMVLDETCLKIFRGYEDFSLCLIGKVKEFASLKNLKVVLGKEGYANIELKYMGGFGVMFVFQDDKTKKRFQFNLATKGLYGWRLRAFHVSGGPEIHLAVPHLDGVPELEEDSEEGYVLNDGSHEDDMYGVYRKTLKIWKVLNKKWYGKNIDDKHEDSLKYLLGFTPNEEGDVLVKKVDNWSDENRVNDGRKMKFFWDHRPIIMLEAHYEYGLIPFKFFHYWFELDGFDKLHKESLNSRKSILKADLADLDGVIDKREGSNVNGQRREVVRLIQEVEKVGAMEMAKKLKLNGPSRVTRTRSIIMHFKNGFEKPNKSRILLKRDFVKIIALEQNDDLEIEVSNEEIKRAVWDCGIDKAPGPDGFTFGFYRRYWDIIGNDVVDVVKLFFLHGEIPKGGSSSFITLIPKVPNANMVKVFRPISLIGSLYKVIAKVLANRLVTILEDIVDEIQSAFVDFEKAYDSVRWDFIDDILRRFGFGEIWCLFNGIKLDTYLQISHLFYADDAIFMGQWRQCNIDTIIQRLDVFYLTSGLRINMNKSNLTGISVGISLVIRLAIDLLYFLSPQAMLLFGYPLNIS